MASGERRHLTVLFCDLVGSTAIAARLDPEEWRETVAGYQRAAAEAISRFGGHVAKYLGDGVMAFFGWPEAHDNDAERAARAGLAILDAIAKLNEQRAQAKLSARIGIDSGAVVVGAGAGRDADVFGATPNLAARIEAAAEPDTVAISDATHRLVSGLFVVEALGAQTFKGLDRPVQLYRVVRPSGMRGRLEAAAAAGGLTPFVGREDELRSLQSRWERVLDGEGQVALIIGEAGIGKSRLVRRFQEQIAGAPHTWIEAGADAFFQNTPFYPVTEILRQFVGDSADQIPQLASRLTAVGLVPAEAIPLLAPLLNLSLPPEYSPSTLSPEQQRRRSLATLVEWVLGSARTQPLVSVIEDLHWADPSTLELIQLLVEQGANAPLLLLYTARPEFHPPWPLRAHHAQLALNRLSARNVRTMVGEVAARNALSDETVAAVVERTGGVPLFVEELTRALLESGDAKLKGHAIPVTLQDSLMARLDRLGPAREVIQIGAVLGSDFSYALLHAVHPVAEDQLEAALRILTDAELLYVRGIAPEATYQFKHALIRDAAYDALLKSRRKELHLIVARTIDEQFPTVKEIHPEVLARHWTEAGVTQRAIAEWERAGKLSESRNAFEEAQGGYRQAVAQLDLLPDSPERDVRKLELRQSLIRMLFMTRGYTEPEAIEAIEHAATLAEKSGNLRQLFNLIIARGISSVVSGDFAGGNVLADKSFKLGIREGSPSVLGRAYMLQTMARFYSGDLPGAEHYFVGGLEFFENPSFTRVPGVAVTAFNHGSMNAWVTGHADVARERMARMMAAANDKNAYDRALAGRFAGELQVWMGRFVEAEATASRLLELSEKHQFSEMAATARCILGLARVRLHGATDGLALIRRGSAELLEAGECHGSTWSFFLAGAQESLGTVTDARDTVDQTLEQPHFRVYVPEALRLRGAIRFQLGNEKAAEADLREAITLADKMSAKAWELRATTSLARVLRDTGRHDEAHAMLAEIYGWFTEGFDTADLRDAKTLLDELAT